MPIIMLHGRSNWLPDPAVAPQHSVWSNNKKLAFTKRLVEQLPAALAQIMNQVDGSALTADEVVIIPQIMHPWASANLSDIWLDIQPSDPTFTYDIHTYDQRTSVKRRMARIRDAMKDWFLELVNSCSLDTNPTMDIEVRLINASGVSLMRDGSANMSWGDA